MRKKSGLTAQEYADIQNLYGYYNLCSDDGDAAGFASCFTEDGVLRIETIDMTVNSRPSIEAFKKKEKESRGGKYRRHRGASLHLEKLDDKTHVSNINANDLNLIFISYLLKGSNPFNQYPKLRNSYHECNTQQQIVIII